MVAGGRKACGAGGRGGVSGAATGSAESPRRDRAMARLPGEDSELRVGRRRRRNLRNSELVTVLGQLRPVPALRHAVSGYRRSWNG